MVVYFIGVLIELSLRLPTVIEASLFRCPSPALILWEYLTLSPPLFAFRMGVIGRLRRNHVDFDHGDAAAVPVVVGL